MFHPFTDFETNATKLFFKELETEEFQLKCKSLISYQQGTKSGYIITTDKKKTIFRKGTTFAIRWNDDRIPPFATETILKSYPISFNKLIRKLETKVQDKKFMKPPVYKQSREVLLARFLYDMNLTPKIRIISSKLNSSGRTRKKYKGICMDSEFTINWEQEGMPRKCSLKELLFIYKNLTNQQLELLKYSTTNKRKYEHDTN